MDVNKYNSIIDSIEEFYFDLDNLFGLRFGKGLLYFYKNYNSYFNSSAGESYVLYLSERKEEQQEDEECNGTKFKYIDLDYLNRTRTESFKININTNIKNSILECIIISMKNLEFMEKHLTYFDTINNQMESNKNYDMYIDEIKEAGIVLNDRIASLTRDYCSIFLNFKSIEFKIRKHNSNDYRSVIFNDKFYIHLFILFHLNSENVFYKLCESSMDSFTLIHPIGRNLSVELLKVFHPIHASIKYNENMENIQSWIYRDESGNERDSIEIFDDLFCELMMFSKSIRSSMETQTKIVKVKKMNRNEYTNLRDKVIYFKKIKYNFNELFEREMGKVDENEKREKYVGGGGGGDGELDTVVPIKRLKLDNYNYEDQNVEDQNEEDINVDDQNEEDKNVEDQNEEDQNVDNQNVEDQNEEEESIEFENVDERNYKVKGGRFKRYWNEKRIGGNLKIFKYISGASDKSEVEFLNNINERVRLGRTNDKIYRFSILCPMRGKYSKISNFKSLPNIKTIDVEMLNSEQLNIYRKIVDNLNTIKLENYDDGIDDEVQSLNFESIFDNMKKFKIFCINACAGTGKTTLANVILKNRNVKGLYLASNHANVNQGLKPHSTICALLCRLFNVNERMRGESFKRKPYQYINELEDMIETLIASNEPQWNDLELMDDFKRWLPLPSVEQVLNTLCGYAPNLIIIDEISMVKYSTFFLLLFAFSTCKRFSNYAPVIALFGDFKQMNAIGVDGEFNMNIIISQIENFMLLISNQRINVEDKKYRSLINAMEIGKFVDFNIIRNNVISIDDMVNVENGKLKEFRFITFTNSDCYRIGLMVGMLLQNYTNVFFVQRLLELREGNDTYFYAIESNILENHCILPLVIGLKYKLSQQLTIRGEKFQKNEIFILKDYSHPQQIITLQHSIRKDVIFGVGSMLYPYRHVTSKEIQNIRQFPIEPCFASNSFETQGETIKGRIFINCAGMDEKSLYVSMTRGCRIEGIRAINI